MKRYISKIAGPLLMALLMISCSEDDATGYSNETPSNPTLQVTTDFNSSETLIEKDTTYTFTVSLSEPQMVNVQVDLMMVGGDATEGEDFNFPHTLTIPSGQTSVTGEIEILADDLVEEPETVQIQIASGLESNVSGITPQTVSFTIQNLEEGDLVIHLDWEASALTTNNSGEEIDPTDLADLRLLLTDPNNPYTEIVETADGASFESLTIDQDIPDGEYYLVADFFTAMDIPTDLNLTLTFDQAGVINNQTFNYSNELNTGVTCPSAFFVMAKVTKSGENYTIESIGEPSPAPSISAGTYSVVSNGESTDPGPAEQGDSPLVDFQSTVTITDNGDGTYTFSDGWAGVYIEWYDIYGIADDQPVTVAIDGCGNLSAEWTGPFGGSQTLTGSLNTDGSFDIRIDNSWGDFIESTYTPN